MSLQAIQPKVTAVIVTYQSGSTLRETLAAARRCFDANQVVSVFVDNGSQDDTTSILQQEASWATVLLTGKNIGFGQGCNLGLAKVQTPYTLFLNPDATVEPEAIQTMIAFMEAHPNVGIVGPATTCGAPGGAASLQLTGKQPTPWSVIKSAVPLLEWHSDARAIFPGEAPFRTGWVCGAIFMIRTHLAQQLGGFDPRFFLYWEETDLCRRSQHLGLETWAVGTAIAAHICGASSEDNGTRIHGCIGKHYYQSRRYYMIKHHGWLAATGMDVVEFVLLFLRTVVDVLRGNGAKRLRPRLQAPLFSLPD